ncbi:MAG: response regulator [Anaerolineae bacterium]|nr:response regulator [Anaerolineae bacterium]
MRRISLRHHPATVALLLFGCLGLAYVGVSIVAEVTFPSDGTILTEINPDGLSVFTAIATPPNGLQEGDRVLEIEGLTVWEWGERALSGGQRPAWEVGQTVTYSVLRHGRILSIPVTLQPFPLSRQLVAYFWVYALAFVSLGVAGYILLARPADRAARLLFFSAANLLFISATPYHLALLVVPELYILENVIEFICESLMFSAIFHLFLIFPSVPDVLRGKERWLYAIHFINPALSIGVGMVWNGTTSVCLAYALTARYWIGLTMLLGSVLSVLYLYFTTREHTVRSQIRWVAWGSVVGLLPFLLLTGVPEIVSGEQIVSIEMSAFFIVAFPVSIAIAVARYRLFDIDTLIHRSLIYALLVLLLTGVYLTLVAVVGPVVMKLSDQSDDNAVVFVSALLVATTFWALRNRAVQWMERLFYRTHVPPAALLRQISAQLSNTIRLSSVAAILTQEIPAKINASHSALMVLNEDASYLELVDGGPFSLSLENVLDILAQNSDNRPIRAAAPPPWLPPAATDILKARNVDLLIPLSAGDQVVGLWGLGPRRSGMPYSSEEVQALSTLGQQAAIAVQNARLVRQLEQYNQQLEHEVQSRTQEMERERNRLNIVLQNVVDGLLVTDPTGRVLLTNSAFDEMVRRPARSTLGRRLDDALAFPALSTFIRETLEKQLRVNTADLRFGEQVFKASASAPRDESGVITVLRDITHEVEVDRMKTEFISTVSHELRTPLTSILGFAKLMRRTFDQAIAPALPDDKRAQRAAERLDQNLSIVVSEGERLTRLINDVLDIAKMEAGRMDWQDEPIDVHSLIAEIVQATSALAHEKGLHLVNQVTQALPCPLADPDRIRQVLTNLISNAIKFTEYGQITIDGQCLPAGSDVHAAHAPTLTSPAVMLSITDSGIGIPPEDIPRLFLRFQQVGGNTLTNKPKGTGLGLAICREIVTHYGGAIWAESTPGQGSRFSVLLPVSAETDATPVALPTPHLTAAAGRAQRRAVILIADDNASIRSLLSQALEEEGYRTLSAIDGADVVSQARLHHPDLIISDVKMPGISGFDALQILKRDPTTADIPFVILSVMEERQQGLALGADAYMSKPVDMADVLATVSTLLRPNAPPTQPESEENHP